MFDRYVTFDGEASYLRQLHARETGIDDRRNRSQRTGQILLRDKFTSVSMFTGGIRAAAIFAVDV